VVHTNIATYLSLLTGQLKPDEALSQGRIRVEGKVDALDRFLKICGVPAVR
jgi:hypothetical protein